MSDINYYTKDYWHKLREHTTARIALGRAGGSLNTAEQLKLFQAHAMARDAVHAVMDIELLSRQMEEFGLDTIHLQTEAAEREQYLLRPDWGRKLNSESHDLLQKHQSNSEIALIVGDGLSAKAVNTHIQPLFKELLPKLSAYRLAAVSLVCQARVAVSDEIGAGLGCQMAVIFLGERPGLSSPDSLGIYLTYAPKPGQTDESRNCISNVRPQGMPYVIAAEKLAYLISEAMRRKISGVSLKDDLQIKLEG